MLSVDLARRLHEAGLIWSPLAGDRFVVDRSGMTHDVFYLADMTVEVHEFVGGSVIGFNGVAEWALDSVALDDTTWLPREDQLRAVLGHDFVGLGLRRGDEDATDDDGGVEYAVVALIEGSPTTFAHRDAEEAYGLATLAVLGTRH
ncbi:pilus assembly protein CpaE [uncultured Serinicoccus sp.]|uniref:pilus assembly protein CpaE n=1 Tax=uncultured Serinicoccus sp. TaxID=735514 RepID=UPI0026147A8B|nr:pilus assembly protein CpaE [uncultured Serinicoccus sp.]